MSNEERLREGNTVRPTKPVEKRGGYTPQNQAPPPKGPPPKRPDAASSAKPPAKS